MRTGDLVSYQTFSQWEDLVALIELTLVINLLHDGHGEQGFRFPHGNSKGWAVSFQQLSATLAAD